MFYSNRGPVIHVFELGYGTDVSEHRLVPLWARSIIITYLPHLSLRDGSGPAVAMAWPLDRSAPCGAIESRRQVSDTAHPAVWPVTGHLPPPGHVPPRTLPSQISAPF